MQISVFMEFKSNKIQISQEFTQYSNNQKINISWYAVSRYDGM